MHKSDIKRPNKVLAIIALFTSIKFFMSIAQCFALTRSEQGFALSGIISLCLSFASTHLLFAFLSKSNIGFCIALMWLIMILLDVRR